jgi:conjugal transfer pilus assembly protein TraW
MLSKLRHIIMLVVTLTVLVLPAYSQDFGTFGDTYPIAEQDFLELIHDRLKSLEAGEGLQDLKAKLVKIVKKRIDRPKQVSKITKATKNSTWILDPTLEIKSDIKDLNGNVIIKAGTKTNPLDIVSLTKTLIFYDADDGAQVKWAQNLDKKLKSKTKLILVNGSIFSQVKLFQKAIYFDQGGILTAHFSIKHVPATVAQTEISDEAKKIIKVLKITEYKI